MTKQTFEQKFDTFECIDIQQCISFDIISEREQDCFEQDKYILHERSCHIP